MAHGPIGRGLFTSAPISAGEHLFSIADVHLLIVPDPAEEELMDAYGMSDTEDEAESRQMPQGHTASSSAAAAAGANAPDGWSFDPNAFYNARSHDEYIKRWQVGRG